jgi:hypothetical protein
VFIRRYDSENEDDQLVLALQELFSSNSPPPAKCLYYLSRKMQHPQKEYFDGILYNNWAITKIKR